MDSINAGMDDEFSIKNQINNLKYQKSRRPTDIKHGRENEQY